MRRFGGLIGGLIVVAAAVGAVLVLTNVITVPGGDDVATNAATRSAPVPTTTRTDPKPPRRPLTPEDPLRLWIAGDSLAGSIGPSLGQLAANTGVVQPQYDSRISSGLLNPNFYNWPRHATQQLALLKPEVVVFVIGTNDANVWNDDLAPEYRIRTETMMRGLVGTADREVFWVGPPVAEAGDLEAGVAEIDRIQRAAAAAVPGVTYVDAHALFSDADGEYQTSFSDQLGRTRVMRADDGVHFSVAGADFIGSVLFGLLDAQWNLTAQAVPGAAKRVLETKGSTQIPGTHRSVDAAARDDSAPSGSRSSSTTAAPPSTTSVTAVTTTTTTVAPSTTTSSTTVVPAP